MNRENDILKKLRNQILGVVIATAISGIGINVIYILGYGQMVENQNDAIKRNRDDIKTLFLHHINNE